MERDVETLPPEIRAAILAAGWILDEGIHARSGFTLATLRIAEEEYTAYYVIKEDADGNKRFEFEILID